MKKMSISALCSWSKYLLLLGMIGGVFGLLLSRWADSREFKALGVLLFFVSIGNLYASFLVRESERLSRQQKEAKATFLKKCSTQEKILAALVVRKESWAIALHRTITHGFPSLSLDDLTQAPTAFYDIHDMAQSVESLQESFQVIEMVLFMAARGYFSFEESGGSVPTWRCRLTAKFIEEVVAPYWRERGRAREEHDL